MQFVQVVCGRVRDGGFGQWLIPSGFRPCRTQLLDDTETIGCQV